MIKTTLASLLVFSGLLTTTLTANAHSSCVMNNKTGELQFMPDNTMQIAIGSKMANDMTKETFVGAIDHVAEMFQPFFAKVNAKLTVNKLWDDNTVNASASQGRNGNWIVNMYGGLARHQMVTVDGLILVLCHEIGHHLGGAPKYQGGRNWASAEGQSDYYGSLKCFRRVVANEDNVAIVAKMQIDPEVTKQCQATYTTENEIAVCQRTSMAAYSVSKMMAGTKVINFTTPDLSQVSKTNENHPAVQCRLDTFFQAALCIKSIDEDLTSNDPTIGACSAKDGLKTGLRPTCWYKP